MARPSLGKSGKSKPLVIRMSNEMHVLVARECKAQKMKAAEYIRHLIERDAAERKAARKAKREARAAVVAATP